MRLVPVPLTQGHIAYIDAADAARVNQFKWCASISKNTVYGMRRFKGPDGKRHPVMLHRYILDAPKGKDVDHIDGNGLNNSRSNLRIVSRAENCRNRVHKPPRGYFWSQTTKKWRSEIVVEGLRIDLGYHATEEAARAAYLAGKEEYRPSGISRKLAPRP